MGFPTPTPTHAPSPASASTLLNGWEIGYEPELNTFEITLPRWVTADSSGYVYMIDFGTMQKGDASGDLLLQSRRRTITIA